MIRQVVGFNCLSMCTISIVIVSINQFVYDQSNGPPKTKVTIYIRRKQFLCYQIVHFSNIAKVVIGDNIFLVFATPKRPKESDNNYCC